jgi:hypothetical protein
MVDVVTEELSANSVIGDAMVALSPRSGKRASVSSSIFCEVEET